MMVANALSCPLLRKKGICQLCGLSRRADFCFNLESKCLRIVSDWDLLLKERI